MSSAHPTVMLIRHGETEWSKSLKHTSSTDIPLTNKGCEAALRLSESVKGKDISQVFSSPRSRAMKTASLVFKEHPIEILEDLREWEYGDYEGLTSAEIHLERPTWNLWTDGCPNGESPADVAKRADSVLRFFADSKSNICAVAHGHILRVLTARYIGLETEFGAHLMLSTGTISLLGSEHERPAIELWNAAEI